ncbi:MAG: alcohol dehydrogenase catalytic domain-containing protein [Thermoflexales bacterium]|nr:alcohol dehydrogenase catalytic domain-containing protein [Thermoflexales bacterium]MCS7324647.1 alcohol dehydrogenase catalytic domain-containing protein [Thermoflexales bacterium]MCX7939811.1 alcohol dehydrogenase catalytic domain-containing protein [Thermoflexales bacterium]MDW8053158.1 alcohol dehydrogenase catalytic domain-containing protein [Anaerolineae bacterium]MDW8291810.1 alcohol dehydrogenase catalytic domain-containing protein [Anaerolineae bacterium]
MRALVVAETLVYREDYPKPEPLPGEALIRVTRAGICNTDIEILKGYFGFRGVLGHEFVGVVEALNPAPNCPPPHVAIGDRVVGEINCVACDSPSRTYAERAQDPARTTLGIDRRDGVFAEYAVLPIVNLHRVPEAVSDDEAVFVEPLAAACQILEQVHFRPTDRVAVLGDGKLGLLCAQVIAAASACELTVIGRHENKLALARDRGIATMHVDQAPLRHYDAVVECTGSPAGFEHARRLLRPRGTLILKSTYHSLPQVNLTMVVVDELTIVGSRCGPFAAALRLLAQRRVAVLPMIHARYPLEAGLQAIEDAQRPGVLKVLLDIAPSTQ